MSKVHVPTFDNMCCNKTKTVVRADVWCVVPMRIPGSLHHCVSVLPPPVPGSRRPAGAGTRGWGAPSPWAAGRRGSTSGSSADAWPSSWCRTPPPLAGDWLELHRRSLFWADLTQHLINVGHTWVSGAVIFFLKVCAALSCSLSIR